MTNHTYNVSIKWTGNKGPGTTAYGAYERSHVIQAPGKTEISCSSDPAFRGDKTKYNPEELLVASLSACHMLWYLHLCTDAGVVVTRYEDSAVGVMKTNADGSGVFEKATLNPVVHIADPSMETKAMALHAQANKMCFIANSVKFPVEHSPVCIIDPPA